METLKETLAKFKNIIIGAVVVILLLVGYNIFVLNGKSDTGGALIRSENQSIMTTEYGREIVATLNRLKGINIDPAFFEEPNFTRLIDFSVEIQHQPVGKDNPFRIVDIFENASTGGEVADAEVLGDVVEESPSTDTVAP